ncbi:spinster family MFS transporter [Sphingoaurantiacus capsulatus]|uniref:Spinster family MFS transporter n=1 Tax=Sphingoaurantiacus capsulatus TaxID=1771310 RepID=A0ABV7XD17_9SPHN
MNQASPRLDADVGSAATRGGGYAWYVVAVLTLFYILSFVDRQILNLLVDPIRAHYGLSDTQISLLQGLSFVFFYSTLGVPIAWLADRSHRRNIIVVGVVFWSLMTAMCGLAPTFLLLFLYRMGVGAGEAALVPAAYSMFSDYFGKEDLGRATSFFQAGGFFGAGLAMMVGGAAVAAAQSLDIVAAIGLAPWQSVFLLVGIPGLLLAPLLFTIREPVRYDGARLADGTAPTLAETLAFVRSRRACLGSIFVGFSLLCMVGYSSLAWLPSFLIRTHGLTPAQAGFSYGAVFCIFSTLGVISGGAVAARLLRRGVNDAALVAALFSAAGLLPSMAVLPFIESVPLLMVAIAASTFFVCLPFGIAPAAIASLTPNRLRAQVSSVYIFLLNVIGLAVGATLVALVTDYYFADADQVGASLAIVGCSATLLAAIVLAWGRPHLRNAMTAR